MVAGEDRALRAAVLSGSLAAGGFRPGRSDLDLLVVVDDGLTPGGAHLVQVGDHLEQLLHPGPEVRRPRPASGTLVSSMTALASRRSSGRPRRTS